MITLEMLGKGFVHHYTEAPRWLVHRRRQVMVTVTVNGEIEDRFTVSDPQTLRLALRPILRHLSPNEELSLRGIDERLLPLSLGGERREVELPDQLAAQRFLSATVRG